MGCGELRDEDWMLKGIKKKKKEEAYVDDALLILLFWYTHLFYLTVLRRSNLIYWLENSNLHILSLES